MFFVNARFLTQPITGVQRYALEMSRALKQIDPSIRFLCPRNVIHHEIAAALGAEPVGRRSGHLWEQIDLPLFLRKRGGPLLISLGTTAPVFYQRKVVTIHDLAFIHYPAAVSWKFRTVYRRLIPSIIRTSLHLTTVSEYSRQDIINVYKPSAAVDVIYNATAASTSVQTRRREPFILAVGSLQPYKNLGSLIDAFALLKTDPGREQLQLVIAGGADRNVFKSASLGDAIGDRTDIRLTGYVSDAELNRLYETASLFVFPSLFEGFGIPPLEAMSRSCPVAASNAASIPEVCSDAALYFNPLDIQDIATKMAMLLDDGLLKDALVAKGLDNVKRFNWVDSARQLLQIARKYSA